MHARLRKIELPGKALKLAFDDLFESIHSDPLTLLVVLRGNAPHG